MQYPAQTGDIHAGDIAKDSKVKVGNYCLSVSGMIYYFSSLENQVLFNILMIKVLNSILTRIFDQDIQNIPFKIKT